MSATPSPSNPPARWVLALETSDSQGLKGLLHEHVCLRLPERGYCFQGRELVGRLLEACKTHFKSWHRVPHPLDTGECVVQFRVRGGEDNTLAGTVLLVCEAKGAVSCIEVMMTSEEAYAELRRMVAGRFGTEFVEQVVARSCPGAGSQGALPACTPPAAPVMGTYTLAG